MLVIDLSDLAMTNLCTDEAPQCVSTVTRCALFNLIILYDTSVSRLVGAYI